MVGFESARNGPKSSFDRAALLLLLDDLEQARIVQGINVEVQLRNAFSQLGSCLLGRPGRLGKCLQEPQFQRIG